MYRNALLFVRDTLFSLAMFFRLILSSSFTFSLQSSLLSTKARSVSLFPRTMLRNLDQGSRLAGLSLFSGMLYTPPQMSDIVSAKWDPHVPSRSVSSTEHENSRSASALGRQYIQMAAIVRFTVPYIF